MLATVVKMVLNFLLSMVLNPTMMDDLYYCGWESFWWSKCIQIHHWFCIWQHQLIQHSKERRRFLLYYYPSCSIWFLTISKKDLPYQSSVLTLKMVLDCNNAIRKKENSVVFPAKNALFEKLSCISVSCLILQSCKPRIIWINSLCLLLAQKFKD